ncbi:MAG TPA: hypothetical protein VNI01_01415 [Elusimicrobiota bacterium]|nr:hypothetical protein [Elusimicrobiota bacterium]
MDGLGEILVEGLLGQFSRVALLLEGADVFDGTLNIVHDERVSLFERTCRRRITLTDDAMRLGVRAQDWDLGENQKSEEDAFLGHFEGFGSMDRFQEARKNEHSSRRIILGDEQFPWSARCGDRR